MDDSKVPDNRSEMIRISNRRVLMILALVVALMFAFAFALVPLYRLVCDVAGINSLATNTTRVAISDVVDVAVDRSRVITVEFDATINGNLPWEFKPNIKKVKVHPGERKQVSYHFKNLSPTEVTTQSVPGVTPWQASKHFQKIECFCFNVQTLAAGEEVDMGLQFVIDPELPEDITTLTLSYTIMDVNREKALQKPELEVGANNKFIWQVSTR